MPPRPTGSSSPYSTPGWRSRSRETPDSGRARRTMAVRGSRRSAYRPPAVIATRSADGGTACVGIFAAQLDQPPLHRRDRALHRRIVAAVIHFVRIALEVVKLPRVEALAIKAQNGRPSGRERVCPYG